MIFGMLYPFILNNLLFFKKEEEIFYFKKGRNFDLQSIANKETKKQRNKETQEDLLKNWKKNYFIKKI